MGKLIAAFIVIGGILIIRAMITPTPDPVLITIGLFFFIIAFILFFKEIKKN